MVLVLQERTLDETHLFAKALKCGKDEKESGHHLWNAVLKQVASSRGSIMISS